MHNKEHWRLEARQIYKGSFSRQELPQVENVTKTTIQVSFHLVSMTRKIIVYTSVIKLIC